MKFLTSFILSILFLCSWNLSAEDLINKNQRLDQEIQAYPAKNIILLIGDGMGISHVSAAAFKKHGMSLSKKQNAKKLNLETLPYLAYANTYSKYSLITDSAAAGTAIATGEKTRNGIISMDINGNDLKTILEFARDIGKSTGLVTSVYANHATPAVFGAHETNRNNYEEILLDYLYDTMPNVILGGGLRLNNLSNKNNQYFYNLARSRGYRVINMNNIKTLYDFTDKKNFVFGTFDEDGNGHLTYRKNRAVKPNEPFLKDLVEKSIRVLERNGDGFFLMVEGGAIDWASHKNDIDTVISEVLEFDRAVKLVLNWLNQEPNRIAETLVIITADHETGGLGINGPSNSVLKKGTTIQDGWTSGGHTAVPVLVWSSGPYASLLQGKIDNTYIFKVMKQAFGIFD